jgi:hypothetical protein
MSAKLASGKTVTYPDFTPPPVGSSKKPNRIVAAFENTVDFLSEVSGLIMQGLIFVVMIAGSIGIASNVFGLHVPEWLTVTAMITLGIVLATVVLGLVVAAVVTPFVVAGLIREHRQVRHNKTVLSDYEYLRVVESLTALGFADAGKLVGAGVLNAEAYLRVRKTAAEIARKQGMSEAEVQYHSHNIGLTMYPDVSALEREVPLLRALNDRGVSDANAALAAATEPQYSVFAEPVSDEEVLASLEPADRKYSGKWEDVSRLEAKMARGHKLTIAERRTLNGSKASARSFGDGIGKLIFGFATTLVGAAVLGAVIAMSIAGAPVLVIVLTGLFGVSLSVAAGLCAVNAF